MEKKTLFIANQDFFFFETKPIKILVKEFSYKLGNQFLHAISIFKWKKPKFKFFF